MNSTIRFISHALLLPICFSGELVAAEDLTNLGGSFTATLPGRHAIQVAAPFVTNVDHRTKQLLGFSLFHRVVGADQGLGPRFNNASCAGCHINNGRGRVGFKQHFSTLSSGNGMVVRVALKGSDLDGSPKDCLLYTSDAADE